VHWSSFIPIWTSAYLRRIECLLHCWPDCKSLSLCIPTASRDDWAACRDDWEKQLKYVNAKIAELVRDDEKISEQYQLATSVIGVGVQTALNVIVTTRCFSRFANWRKLACFSGIAPMPYESGSSIKGRRKISHLADKKLKSLLNMAAMSAKRCDPEIKLYYERKKLEGKHHRVIMNAIRCKVLSRIFATVKRGTPYVNTTKFIAA